MYYVYILESKKDNSRYTGITENLKQRIKSHNYGNQQYTKGKRPYAIRWYCTFPDKKKAINFEKYLKTASGIAFSRKRLL
jgi:predicted GIY-YIG superfamily endonuclease